jgi:predicted HNH restriction endonuclease
MKIKLCNHQLGTTVTMSINDFIKWFNEFDTIFTLESVETKKVVKPKASSLPNNWQGNGRFRLLDKATNTHFETDFENACIQKGITPKQAFTVKSDKRDRSKEFKGRDTLRMAAKGDIQGYVYHWLKANHLIAEVTL